MASPVAGLDGLIGQGSDTSPHQLTASALELLLATGRATAAVGPTPLARFNTVGWWAVRRWYWTVHDAPAGHVDLAPSSNQIKNHHRGAFSEALGLGTALLLAEFLLSAGQPAVPVGVAAGGAPVVVDIDSLLQGNSVRPDLWVLAELPTPGGSPPKTILLEAKGRTRPGANVAELARGTHQVLAITGATRRIVAGVEVPRTALTAFAIEVLPTSPSPGPEGSAVEPPSAGELPQAPPSRGPRDPKTVRKRRKASLDKVAPETVARADAARLRAFASLDDTAFAERRIRNIATNVNVEIEGVTFRIDDGAESVELTVGLLADVAEELRVSDSDPERFQRSRARASVLRDRLAAEDPSRPTRAAVANDGCVIAVRRL